MPVTIEDILGRLDTPQLSELLPKGAFGLLAALDPALVYPKNLKSMVLQYKSAFDLLSVDVSRNLLLGALPPADAWALSAKLGAKPGQDPYLYMTGLSFSPRRLDLLFQEMNVRVPEPEVFVSTGACRTIEPQYPLFPYQIRVLAEVKRMMSVDPHRALLHMPTGSGKTRTAMNLICDHLRQVSPSVVVWLAHSEELCDQAAQEFERAWSALGNRSLDLVRCWGRHNSDLTKLNDGFVVLGLTKAFSLLRRSDMQIRSLSGKRPLVVLDEAHRAIAPTYQQILQLLVMPTTNSRLLGLSATPGRTWNDPDADRELSEFFGLNKASLRIDGYPNPIDFLVAEGYLAKPVFRRISFASGLALSTAERNELERELEVPASVLNRLGEDQLRNLQVVREVEKMLARHKRMIFFATSTQQSDLIAAVLTARGHVARSVTSRTPVQQRSEVIASYSTDDPVPQVLCNFGVLTTGFDAPATSAALIARPTYSLVLYSQMIGRALRGPRAGGNPEAEIVTVVDPALPGFGSVESAFSNWEDVWNQSEG